MFREWRSFCNQSSVLQNIQCDLDNKDSITSKNLIFGVSQFITEVKKLDATDFPAKTLYDLIACIQFYLATMGFAWKLLIQPQFQDIKFTLDNMMKLRTLQGVGRSV